MRLTSDVESLRMGVGEWWGFNPPSMTITTNNNNNGNKIHLDKSTRSIFYFCLGIVKGKTGESDSITG